jgi:hypothetical protein
MGSIDSERKSDVPMGRAPVGFADKAGLPNKIKLIVKSAVANRDSFFTVSPSE